MKKLILITLAVLMMAISAEATTRKDIQAAMDFIKYVNIQNDVIDSVKPILNGEVEKDIPSEVFGEAGTKRPYTLEELKELTAKSADVVKLYKSNIDRYIKDPVALASVKAGLTALGIDYDEMIADSVYMTTVADKMKIDIEKSKDKNELKAIATDVGSKVPELNLIRKAK